MPTTDFKIICLLADMQGCSYEVLLSTGIYRCNLLIKNHGGCRSCFIVSPFLNLLLPLCVEQLGLLAGAWGRLVNVHHVRAAACRHVLLKLSLMITASNEVTRDDNGRASTFFMTASTLSSFIPANFGGVWLVIKDCAVYLVVSVLWLAEIARPRRKPSPVFFARRRPPVCQQIYRTRSFVELYHGTVLRIHL